MLSTIPSASAVLISLSLFSFSQMASAASSTSSAAASSSTTSMNSMTYVGCFNSSTPMKDQGSYTYQSSGYCQGVCYALGDSAMGLYSGSDCYCGNYLPAKADLVDDDNCDSSCNGYPEEDCGGDSYWSVYKTGVDDSVSYYEGSSDSSSSSSSSSSTTTAASGTTTKSGTTNTPVVSTSVAPGTTVVVTLSATDGTSSTSTSSSSKKSSTNTAGIAAGVVVGVLGLAALIGGVYFYMRYRKRQQAQQEYQRRSQAQEYGMGGARGMSMRSNDVRLDPEAMRTRRLSDGSIADEQDYSRRILKVTNPDDR